uniref:Uncharacterized protein n=1 Tax=Globodera rostochiensis TaxID=31243 RepID=A0A914GS21_GLORO
MCGDLLDGRPLTRSVYVFNNDKEVNLDTSGRSVGGGQVKVEEEMKPLEEDVDEEEEEDESNIYTADYYVQPIANQIRTQRGYTKMLTALFHHSQLFIANYVGWSIGLIIANHQSTTPNNKWVAANVHPRSLRDMLRARSHSQLHLRPPLQLPLGGDDECALKGNDNSVNCKNPR